MASGLSDTAQKVQKALHALGLSLQVVELPNSTRTAAEAAEAVGSQVGQIVKSLVFRRDVSGRPVLILASGANRVNLEGVAALVGEPLGKADADYVRHQTGFAIGGVPPVGHLQALDTWIDEDLFQYAEIWAAAGTPNAVFRLVPDDLLRMTGGTVIKIT
jgi:prolyl-tRNA editing enzyme YbaK/EbsC (Cys-tRNA(Pro) deacylase)